MVRGPRPMPQGQNKTPAIPYASALNPAQYQAVTHPGGPLLVIAGAGTGKTRTLVYRVAYLVEQGVDPRSILLLTFTRKAAQEMMERASQILDARCAMVAGGTFHSFANLILRRYGSHVGYPASFTIADRSDAEDILNLIRTDLGFHKDKARFPKKRALMNIISRAANCQMSVGQVLAQEYPQYEALEPEIEEIARTYARYKEERAIMDYDDLLTKCRDLLRDHPPVRQRLSWTYAHVLIDEFQDTNAVQAEIGAFLASEHGNIMAVGDDCQSIYSFRGADFRNIMDFPKRFPGSTVITLEENYRSTQPILSFTNAIIENAREKYSKRLFTKAEGGAKPIYTRPPSELAQALYVLQRIQTHLQEGVPPHQIAVLFRAGWHSNDLEVLLGKHGIAFVKYGGMKFIEAAHIKDVLAFLKATVNPADTISWHRILQLLEGVGPVTAKRLAENVKEKGLESLVSKSLGKRKYGQSLRILHDTMTQLTTGGEPVSQKIEAVLTAYQPLLEAKYDDAPKRIPDLRSLQLLAERYENLETLLADLTLESPEQALARENGPRHRKDHVVLSTIHSAKGLEWHTVFIIHLVDGHLPSSYSLHDEDAIEEERRLFYVAATRAKCHLYLVAPKVQGQASFYSLATGGPSRFLFEIGRLGKLVRRDDPEAA
ncbi:DNA helicase-2 / ATP-dependent DNA helicase PcrA [Desulfacinum hydrothermale DSM 13146]|uniref:DNA 3'-5' helicase n=1 Tax=Desulfacinum hydrothermale DSM 13146 TaxID=1121390 RepID=A0A1W1XTB8_9BACT|nr:ATP-dependent helicase [Desulfacinum hydrothermale]SMC27209.1 DNA helicase-2 / ATP-dependent DNA helicase PcrA [Desulfacinum hydrothermale DSM 13146]